MKVREMIRLLEDNGWEQERMRGDHRTFKKKGVALVVTIPGKLGNDIPKGLEHAILRTAGLRK